MSEEINYLVLYLKKEYHISNTLQKILINENFTSPYALKYIDISNIEPILEGDQYIINLLMDLTIEELERITYDIILMYKLYIYNINKLNLILFLEKYYLISQCLKEYLINNNYSYPSTLKYIDTSNFKQGDRNFLEFFNSFDTFYYDIINKKIYMSNYEKKYMYKHFKEVYLYSDEDNMLEMEID